MENLPKKPAVGVLVKRDHPKRQGRITISINEKRSTENNSGGIGVDHSGYWGKKDGFEIEMFLSNSWYQMLRERGSIGTRHNMYDGSEVQVHDKSRIDSMGLSSAESYEWYRDERDRLPADFE